MDDSRGQVESQREHRYTVDDIADAIRGAVADDRLAYVVVRRVALAAADGMISRSELARQLAYIAEGRRAGTIKVPGAYFVTCAKQLYAAADLPWSTVPGDG